MSEIWILDDDRSVRFVLAESMRDAGYSVRDFDNARAALSVLAHAEPDVVFTDVRMPGTDGFAFLDALKRAKPDVPVIVMSAYTDVASTSAAFRGGAFDFLPKPFDLDAATRLVERALAQRGQQAPPRVATLVESALLGESAPMRELFRAIGRVAATNLNVLITGETGTGKELVARALHTHSLRNHAPLVALNTAAIPSELLESELFGHEAGAFTGAHKRHIGRFEQAAGGTLFLDEIGDMPIALQTRLLRVLAEGEFYRVGGRELIRVDVRVIAATNVELQDEIVAGRFREDLFYRLNVIPIYLPALRERGDDIVDLVNFFVRRYALANGFPTPRISPDTMRFMQQYDWPGNVRELQNYIERSLVLATSNEITPDLLPAHVRGLAPVRIGRRASEDLESLCADLVSRRLAQLGEDSTDVYNAVMNVIEKELLLQVLRQSQGVQTRTAARLGINRNTLHKKIEDHNLGSEAR